MKPTCTGIIATPMGVAVGYAGVLVPIIIVKGCPEQWATQFLTKYR
jgi:hypothetical protein